MIEIPEHALSLPEQRKSTNMEGTLFIILSGPL
jgi:hypothetical protein